MNRYQRILAAAFAAMLVASCTTHNAQSTADDDKVYVTGSRIPRHDRSAVGLKSTEDKNAIDDMMRRSSGATATKGGN